MNRCPCVSLGEGQTHGPSLVSPCNPRLHGLCLENTSTEVLEGWVLEAYGNSEPGLGPKTVILTKGNNPINAGAEGEEDT